MTPIIYNAAMEELVGEHTAAWISTSLKKMIGENGLARPYYYVMTTDAGKVASCVNKV